MHLFLHILLVLLLTQTATRSSVANRHYVKPSDGNCESVQSGDWTNPATWSCNRLPTIDDLVTINAGHSITVSTNTAQAKQIIYRGGSIQFSGTGANVFVKNGSSDVVTPISYRIRAGQQYCDQSALVFTPKTTLSFSATFDNSAIYVSQLPENQNDINKLYGFSDCNTHHSIASARFGWKLARQRFADICLLLSQRRTGLAGVGRGASKHGLRLPAQYRGRELRFSPFRDNKTVIARGCTLVESTQRYLLYPYFGGDEVAPHDITIAITDK